MYTTTSNEFKELLWLHRNVKSQSSRTGDVLRLKCILEVPSPKLSLTIRRGLQHGHLLVRVHGRTRRVTDSAICLPLQL